MIKVSVVVAIYNVEKYLKRCLESLCHQSFDNYELILVNDGSSDNSAAIIDEYYLKYPNLIRVLNKQNGGLSDARNCGLSIAHGEYIMFIDGDDFVEADCLKQCVLMMEKGLDLLIFDYNQYYLKNNTKEKISLNLGFEISNLNNKPSILAYMPNAAWNKMYKTKLFKDNGIYYPYSFRHQDLGTSAKLLLQADKVGYLNKALYNYLIDRPNNITQQIDSKIYHIITMSKEIIEYYKEHQAFEKYQSELMFLVKINCSQSLKKAMKLKDKKFVFKFIDDVFNMYDKYFKNTTSNYDLVKEVGSKIYLNKYLLKMYYYYLKLKGGNR